MKAVLLLLVTVWSNSQSGGSVPPPPCTEPPSKWCSSLESAISCEALNYCLEANFTRSRLNADPVEVALYYESLCPGCRLFLTQMLLPTWTMLSDIMSVTLVPYGNTEETPDGHRFNYSCQHGERECLGNMIETCLINLTSDAYSIIQCMESTLDVVTGAQICTSLYDPDLKWQTVQSCVNGDLGNKLMHQNALMTGGLRPPHKYVPWVTINGEHTDELQDKAMNALFPLVCSLYKGTRPLACGGGQRHYISYC